MEWVGITGTWSQSCSELERDLVREVKSLLSNGAAIVTGGALGVDFLATELALTHETSGAQLKVLLPATLATYQAHYRLAAQEERITADQAEALISQLEAVEAVGSLFVIANNPIIDEKAYYERNTEVVKASDRLCAFQIAGSKGTQDTIDKARARQIPVRIFRYS